MIRQPTPRAVQYDFWRRTVAGERVARIEDEPQPGFYKRRMVRGGPFVPVEIWLEQDIDPETGELLADERLQAICNAAPCDPIAVWTYCRAISAEEYAALTGVRERIPDMALIDAALNLGRMAAIPAGIEIETEMRDVTPRHAQEVKRKIETAETPAAAVIEDAGQVDPEIGEVTTAAQKAADPKPHSQRQQRSSSRDQQPQGGLVLGGAPSLSERIQMLSQSITDNLHDRADLESTLDMFDAQLDQIRQEAPDEYDAMLAELQGFVTERDGTDA